MGLSDQSDPDSFFGAGIDIALIATAIVSSLSISILNSFPNDTLFVLLEEGMSRASNSITCKHRHS